MAELNYPDPSESPWEDPNGKVWTHDGDGWVCIGESTSEDSVRVTVYDTPGAHTHTFHVNAIRAEVIVTGGGGGGGDLGRSGGVGGATAIKTHDITSASASIVVGSGGAAGSGGVGTNGSDSTYGDGTVSLTAQGGTGGIAGSAAGAVAAGGDININGGSSINRTAGSERTVGGASYWGSMGTGDRPSQIALYGAGGTGAENPQSGNKGVVYVKEFLVVKPAPTYSTSRAPKTTV